MDLATEPTRNARMTSAMLPASVKIPTSHTSVRMPVDGQISSSSPKITFRIPAASVHLHAVHPAPADRERAADLPDP